MTYPLCHFTRDAITGPCEVTLLPLHLRTDMMRREGPASWWLPAAGGIQARFVDGRFELLDTPANRVNLVNLCWWLVFCDFREITAFLTWTAKRVYAHVKQPVAEPPQDDEFWKELCACWTTLFPQPGSGIAGWHADKLGLMVMRASAWRELTALQLNVPRTERVPATLRATFDRALAPATTGELQREAATRADAVNDFFSGFLWQRMAPTAQWVPPIRYIQDKVGRQLAQEFWDGRFSADALYAQVQPWLEALHACEGLRYLHIPLAPVTYAFDDRQMLDTYMHLLQRVRAADAA